MIKDPLLYVSILQRKINEHLMESMSPNILPKQIFFSAQMKQLDYLEYHPHDKKIWAAL